MILALGMLAPGFLVYGQSLPEKEFGEPWNGVGVGVRALGMGGAYTALGEECLGGMYWNPAGLIRARDTQLSVMSGTPTMQRGNWLDPLTRVGAFGFMTSAFRPWAAGLMVARNFHGESMMPWQEDYWLGSFILPLNAARTGGIGVNVKYLRSDRYFEHPYVGEGFEQDRVTGWGIDVGMLYRMMMPLRDRRRELDIGVMARNMAGRSRVENVERSQPGQAQLGLAFVFDDLIPREKSIISFNYDQALRASLGNVDTQLRVGFEQWFWQYFGGIRFGYATPVPRYKMVESENQGWSVGSAYYGQGRPAWTCGLTFNVMGLTTDIAMTTPVEKKVGLKVVGKPEVEYTRVLIESTGQTVDLPLDTTRVYVGVTYHWLVAKVVPYAKVGVEPLVFSPRKGEVAVFTIDWKDERGVESWEMVVKNSARVPVRVFTGRGAPPGRLVWDGLDDRFNLVPDDEHTYSLMLRNRDGEEAVTAPQSMRVFTPGEGKRPGDPSMIYKVLEEQARREAAGTAAVKPLIAGQVKGMKEGLGGEEAVPVTETVSGGEVPLLFSDTVTGMSETVTGVGIRGLGAEQVLRFEVPEGGGAGDRAVLEYTTQQYIVKYLAKEIGRLTGEVFGSVGGGIRTVVVQARYGNHLMVIETPLEVARALKEGRIGEKRWLEASKAVLDGTAIEPKVE